MAKKNLANRYDNNKPIAFSYNFSEKQNMAYGSTATELFFGG